MSLTRLLADLTPQQFVRDFYFKQAFSQRGSAAALRELGSSESVREILSSGQADCMLAREGRLWEGDHDEVGRATQPTYEQVRQLHEAGYTLVIRHAEKHHAGLRELAAGFQRDFRAPVNVHVYCTPADNFGFGWHYDAEDVFFIQTEGAKEYSLRKNTVNPWPIEETLPADMKFEREIMPLVRCLLEPGDWLYLPAGYWHMGQSKSPAITLAVGVMSPTGMDVMDSLRRMALDSLLWRQRLPVPGDLSGHSREELEQQFREYLEQLTDDLRRQLTSPECIQSLIDRPSVC